MSFSNSRCRLWHYSILYIHRIKYDYSKHSPFKYVLNMKSNLLKTFRQNGLRNICIIKYQLHKTKFVRCIYKTWTLYLGYCLGNVDSRCYHLILTWVTKTWGEFNVCTTIRKIVCHERFWKQYNRILSKWRTDNSQTLQIHFKLAIWIPYSVYITGTWTLNLTEQFVNLYIRSCWAWAHSKKRNKLVW